MLLSFDNYFLLVNYTYNSAMSEKLLIYFYAHHHIQLIAIRSAGLEEHGLNQRDFLYM